MRTKLKGIFSALLMAVIASASFVQPGVAIRAMVYTPPVLCPGANPLLFQPYLFSDDLETGAANWSFASTNGLGLWDRSTSEPVTGSYSLFWPGVNNVDSRATMVSDVFLPAGKASYLYFDHKFNFDYYLPTNLGYDGGVLEYSTDSGAHWYDVRHASVNLFSGGQDYNVVMANVGSALAYRPAFSGKSNGDGTQVSSRYELTSLAGQNVRFRWRTASDGQFPSVGWRVDNVKIYTCYKPTHYDFNGDGSADVAVYRPSAGQWYAKDVFGVTWGTSEDIPVAGDYNGDGAVEVANYRPSIGAWFVMNGQTTTWGVSTDQPVPMDYNGDGTTDVAVFRPSTGQWFVKDQFTVYWGESTDIPVPGDYNGDGSTDIAVYRPSTGQWLIKDQATVSWGESTDIPVPGDYNGDGSTDVAIYRPSTGQWFVKDQFDSFWGMSTDIAVPGDYDGNGAMDIAVFRPETGQWFIKDEYTAMWGVSGDIPIPEMGTGKASTAP